MSRIGWWAGFLLVISDDSCADSVQLKNHFGQVFSRDEKSNCTESFFIVEICFVPIGVQFLFSEIRFYGRAGRPDFQSEVIMKPSVWKTSQLARRQSRISGNKNSTPIGLKHIFTIKKDSVQLLYSSLQKTWTEWFLSWTESAQESSEITKRNPAHQPMRDTLLLR